MTSALPPFSRKNVHPPPVVLSVAGSDCSAGAGIQADLKSVHAAGCYALTAVTSVVAEVPGEVRSIRNLPPDFVLEQVEICFEHYPVAAVKTGMLPSGELVAALAEYFEKRRESVAFWLVVDPVMVASSGDRLVPEETVCLYLEKLIPLANLVTPNLHEAEVLLGKTIGSPEDLSRAASELYRKTGAPFLCKGGHLPGELATDILATGDAWWKFGSPFVVGAETHGTGCSYSAAIAAQLALGEPLPVAVGMAKQFLTASIAATYDWGGVRALSLDAPRGTDLPPLSASRL